MRNKKIISIITLTAMTVPAATIAAGTIHASGTLHDEIYETVEDAHEDLRELASEGVPSGAIEAVKTEIEALKQTELAQLDAGNQGNADRFEDAVEDLVDDLKDRFEASRNDSDDDADEGDEIAERRADLQEAIAKATSAIDAAGAFVDTDLIAETRALLATLVERANNAHLTSRQLKALRDDIRALGKRFHNYLESDDEDEHSEERTVGFRRVVEVMQAKAKKFGGDKKERFEARAQEFQARFEAAEDGESRRKAVEQERNNRIEEAKTQVANLIERINNRLDNYASVDATDETLAAARTLQASLYRIATQGQTAETREDLRVIRDLINAEREEIGRLFSILEDLIEDTREPEADEPKTAESVSDRLAEDIGTAEVTS
ncbi:MAG: hypothetical protein VX582_02090 [Actinomycetota bacterium]|nr:hypothetical protein [Actinomycetota bacterium]